jgi:hypothetical protein
MSRSTSIARASLTLRRRSGRCSKPIGRSAKHTHGLAEAQARPAPHSDHAAAALLRLLNMLTGRNPVANGRRACRHRHWSLFISIAGRFGQAGQS